MYIGWWREERAAFRQDETAISRRVYLLSSKVCCPDLPLVLIHLKKLASDHHINVGTSPKTFHEV